MCVGGCQPDGTSIGSTQVVVANTRLSPDVHRVEVGAARVARVRRPGQFVIVHLGPGAERIPLTIADSDPEVGPISLVIQAVGKSRRDLVSLRPGDTIDGIAGPLGHPTDLVAGARAGVRRRWRRRRSGAADRSRAGCPRQ